MSKKDKNNKNEENNAPAIPSSEENTSSENENSSEETKEESISESKEEETPGHNVEINEEKEESKDVPFAEIGEPSDAIKLMMASEKRLQAEKNAIVKYNDSKSKEDSDWNLIDGPTRESLIDAALEELK